MLEQHDYVLMRMDGLNLMFPRNQVLVVESMSSVCGDESHAAATGKLVLDNQELPVYALSKEFDLVSGLQGNQPFCVCFDTADISERYALACASVEQYTVPNSNAVQQLPAYMRMLHSPVRGMLRIDRELGLLCTVESMQAYLQQEESLGG